MRDDQDDLINAVDKIADTSFVIAERPSGSAVTGFYRPGERHDDGAPFTPTTISTYSGPPPSGHSPSNEEKRGAWQLQEEYLASWLGKDEVENGTLWDTVKWINRHYAVTKTPAEALPPLSIYVGEQLSTEAPTGPDDETPDKTFNEGREFESINVCQTDKRGNTKVMDENGTTHQLDLKIDDYGLLRIIDALEDLEQDSQDRSERHGRASSAASRLS